MDMPKPDPAVLARKATVLERLKEVLPEDAVIHDEAETLNKLGYRADADERAALPSAARETASDFASTGNEFRDQPSAVPAEIP